MWLSRLELTHFKSYQRQVFEFPQPQDGKNIVLIGGMNGYGKTSILEALYLCLYGKDAIVHLARAGLKQDDRKGYPTFLERAFNGEASRDKKDTMIVRLAINLSKSKAIDISRKWYFRSNGSWTGEEEAVYRDLIRDVPDTPKVDGRNGFHLSSVLDEIFVPAHIAPFFFFDGEEVKKLADQSRIEQVKQGLEGLLGVVLLRTLADRLKNFESTKRGEVVSVDEGHVYQLLDSLTENENQLHLIDEELSVKGQEREELRNEQKSLVQRITAAGGGGGDIATVKELVEEREQTRNKLKECQDKLLGDILTHRLPLHLIPRNLIESFRDQLQAEIRYQAWESEKLSLAPRKSVFEKAFLAKDDPFIDPPLSDDQISVIKARIDAAWSSLFYPPPDDCAKQIIHDYLHDPLQQKTLDFISRMGLGRQEIQTLVNEQHALEQRSAELARKISQLEGIDRDGTLSTLKKNLHETSEKLDATTEQIRQVERKQIALHAQVSSQRAEYEREKNKLDASSPVRFLIEKSERVRKVIDEVVPALFPLKVKELARAMTIVYKQLAHKGHVNKIEISDDGTTRILSKSGREISFDRSAGENQIFATALIAGLAQVSNVRAPMVVDTPLGRLDSKHRANILKFWTSDAKRQVILLSQDEEIDHELYAQISSHVGKTYLLTHIEVDEGIGRTTAVEGSYFGEKQQ